ncbi:four-carbon acid sugar kinase family protein [Alteribacillus sp. HJP-4]|uniref:four-carbon acid sugar kinase family protein n=1 Tax=Alteribacillus sp. HJP-4 TaxID=2775394 RepID=UPI0035CCE272
MDLCIVADDLTGANDSGVQCTQFGYRPSVALNAGQLNNMLNRKALIIDTDSRALEPGEAYKKVKEALNPLVKNPPKVLYKKIDSTMRGNIGAELDAVFDTFKPDFIAVAPGYPSNGRTVINGELFVDGVLLTETNISTHPDHHFETARPDAIIQEQSKNQTVHLSVQEVLSSHLSHKLAQLKKDGVSYISLDSSSEEDLRRQIEKLSNTAFSIMLAGSAGAAQYLSSVYHLKDTIETRSEKKKLYIDSALFVIGSMNNISAVQLENLKETGEVKEYLVEPSVFFEADWQYNKNITRILNSIHEESSPFLLLHPDTSEESVTRIKEISRSNNISMAEATRQIASCIGKLVQLIFLVRPFDGLVMTGGDIAKAICTALESSEFELHYEFEKGIPLGKLKGNYEPLVITKAGAFGSKNTFVRMLHAFKGEVHI